MREKTFNKLAVVLILSLMLLFASAGVLGQSLKNYKGEIIYKEQPKNDVKATSYTYEDKGGNIYSVYVTSKKKFFIYKVSKKTGKYYKYYLPEKYQEKLRESYGY